MGAEVLVAEAEPLGLDPVCRELTLDGVRLVLAPPALALVDAAAEGVEHRVEVGGDAQPEEGDVVAGVADDGDRGPGQLRGAGEVGEQTAQEARSADPSSQGGDVHDVSLAAALVALVLLARRRPATGAGRVPDVSTFVPWRSNPDPDLANITVRLDL